MMDIFSSLIYFKSLKYDFVVSELNTELGTFFELSHLTPEYNTMQ